MLTIYENRSGALERQKGKPRITEAAVWIDLLNPTHEEEGQIERALRLEVPTREEQQEIEASSRLYQENGAYYMTATLLYRPEQGEPRTTPVTFILTGQRLIKIRYAEPRAFSIYIARCNRSESELKSGAASRQRRFDVLLRAIGREGEITSKARESARSFGRLLTFLVHAANERKEVKPLQARIRTAARDVVSLTDHPPLLSRQIIFL